MAGRTLNLQSIKDKEKRQTAQTPKTINHKQKHTMHTTLSTSEIAGALIKDEFANWSRNGALALSEYLESLELEQGIELDVVALRCEFSEYESAIEAAAQYAHGSFTTEEAALEYLEDQTSVITYDGGVIIQDF